MALLSIQMNISLSVNPLFIISMVQASQDGVYFGWDISFVIQDACLVISKVVLKLSLNALHITFKKLSQLLVFADFVICPNYIQCMGLRHWRKVSSRLLRYKYIFQSRIRRFCILLLNITLYIIFFFLLFYHVTCLYNTQFMF